MKNFWQTTLISPFQRRFFIELSGWYSIRGMSQFGNPFQLRFHQPSTKVVEKKLEDVMTGPHVGTTAVFCPLGLASFPPNRYMEDVMTGLFSFGNGISTTNCLLPVPRTCLFRSPSENPNIPLEHIPKHPQTPK